ncbi:hypothetical protein [Clostridium botulinum]|uniref:hypothetical protein n=2 Tax=Clostridiaceae TaxID=31979 RepID=UPI0002DCF666|nr:hypothetical protein [Clostridium botulinum]MBY6837984.1 hypothetical protein [Clostridium botulinum]NFL51860.1 hypothetical protein [Clostridium botulinum]
MIMMIIILAFCIFIINNPKAKVIKAIKETNKEMSYRKTFFEKATGEKDFLRIYEIILMVIMSLSHLIFHMVECH